MPENSIFKCSIKHLVFVAFALLALLPTLALLRMGVVMYGGLDGTWATTVHLAGLGLFVVISLTLGLSLLVHFAGRIRVINQESESLRHQTCLRKAEGDHQEAIFFPSHESQNELESLTTTLSRLRNELANDLGRLHDQAFFLQNLQKVLDNSDDMVIIADPNDNVLYSNRTARAELGIMPERRLRYALAEGALSGTDYERCAQIFECWEDRDDELTVYRLDGSPLTVRIRVAIFNDGPDSERTKIIALRDVSEQKRLERQLYRSEKLASLGQLISGVAHELNNPLAAILGFAELSRDTNQSMDDVNCNLEIIEREAKRTAHIVENLLNFSRQRSAQRSVADVHHLLERCFDLLGYNFRTSNITIRRNYDAGVPHLEMDEYQVQQVFMNIIVNAVQAMSAAETTAPMIAIKTYLTEDGKNLGIDIEDNGPGMPTDVLNRVFEPFFTTKPDDQGTGLGLPVSLNIIHNHGGKIQVQSTVGNGTTFSILLPAESGARSGTHQSKLKSSRRKLDGRVLVVDDEDSLVKMSCRALEQVGLETATASSVREAIGKLQAESFDLVLVDVCMPDGDGTQIWDFVREKQARLTDSVIFVTGDPRIKHRIHSQYGVEPPLLLKPFHVSELQKLVRERLTVQSRSAT